MKVATAIARLRSITSLPIILLLLLTGCAKDSGEKEPGVPVHVVAVEKKTIKHTVTAEAILFPLQQGAMPRKELDQAGVDLTNARNQHEIAQKHLEALLAVGRQQQLKSAAGQLESAKGKYLGAAAQLSYSEIRSPIDGVVADRPLYP